MNMRQCRSLIERRGAGPYFGAVSHASEGCSRPAPLLDDHDLEGEAARWLAKIWRNSGRNSMNRQPALMLGGVSLDKKAIFGCPSDVDASNPPTARPA